MMILDLLMIWRYTYENVGFIEDGCGMIMMLILGGVFGRTLSLHEVF